LDFLEDICQMKELKILKIYMEAENFCQINELEVLDGIDLEKLTFDFSSKSGRHEYFSLGLMNLFKAFPRLNLLKLT
jgi:hypothetical protein